VADAHYENQRLAAIYDPLEPDRSDLNIYTGIVTETGARRVLDIRCGTGTFCCLLARGGLDVVGLDPAKASLAVARSKPGADRVRWIHGEVAALPRLQVDLATMTANVAQVFLTEEAWAETLHAAHAALRPGGWLVFETRDPERQEWLEWTPKRSRTEIAGVGVVESWGEVTKVNDPFVSFRWHYRPRSSGLGDGVRRRSGASTT
jgi:SAM-dependent methyltransferase